MLTSVLAKDDFILEAEAQMGLQLSVCAVRVGVHSLCVLCALRVSALRVLCGWSVLCEELCVNVC